MMWPVMVAHPPPRDRATQLTLSAFQPIFWGRVDRSLQSAPARYRSRDGSTVVLHTVVEQETRRRPTLRA
jgi:hypothetical protein